MTPEIYTAVLISISCFLLYFGVHLCVCKIPCRLESSVYDKARQLMGYVFIFIAVSVFLFFGLGLKSLPSYHRVAYNISCYYIISKLITFSFITLIGRRPKFKELNKRWTFWTCHVYVVLVWSTLLLRDPQTIHTAQIICAAILLASIINDVRYFFKRYKEVVQKGDLLYPEGVDIYINWMIKSIYGFIGAGIFSAAIAFSTHIPKLLLALYLVYFLAVCIYTFNRYLDFMIIFKDLVENSKEVELVPETEFAKVKLTPEKYEYLHTQIQMWIDTKGYCSKSASIQEVSTKIYTNKQYLSNYINTTYKCSFRVWISKLRIDEAKRLLLKSPETTITAVADQVGFQSLTSFTRAFTHNEGVSPTRWVQSNRV